MSKITEKVCTGCKTLKAADAFAAKKDSSDGLQSYCRGCQKESRAAWAKANADKVAAYNEARRTAPTPSERPLRGGGEKAKKASEARATAARASSAAAEHSETSTSGFADGNKEDSIAVVQTAGFANLPHAAVVASLTNPRKNFDRAFIEGLAASIREHGLAQPILVRPLPGSRVGETYSDRRKDAPRPTHEIVAGEQRWRACELAGVRFIPALIKDLTDQQVLELQLIENLKRRDLHPMEEAEGYERLRDTAGMTVEAIAERIGKGRSYVYKTMSLLDLLPEARAAFYEGKLTKSTAELVAARQHNLQLQVLKEITAADFHGDVMSYRKAKAHVDERYMLRLDSAVFKITDETLVPKAGSCRTCPKRSGANPDLFEGNEDNCTDPSCFAGKKEAHYARVRTDAEAKGQTVITGREAKEIMPDSNTMRGYTKVDDHQAFGGQMKTLRKVLGKDMPTPTLLEDPKTHEMIEVLPTAVVGKLLKDQGIAKAPTVESNEAAAKRRAAETFEKTWRRQAIEKIDTALQNDGEGGFNAPVLRQIALILVDCLGTDARSHTCTLLGLGRIAPREAIEGHITGCADEDVDRVLLLLLAQHDAEREGPAQRIDVLAKEYRVDVDAIRQGVKTTMKKEVSDQKVASAVAAVKAQAAPAKPARKPKATAAEAQAEIATQLQQASNPNSFSAGQRVLLKADLRRNVDVFKTKATEAEVVRPVGDRAWEVKPEALSFTLIADYTEMEAIAP